jgi:hypothetical protein
LPTAKFLSQDMVAHRAAKLLRRFVTLTGVPATLPMPIDRIAEDVCDLGILWEPIPEEDGHSTLAELRPAERLVVFNERRQSLFDSTPFLYNTVLAHEVGHWCLHLDQAVLDQRAFPGFAPADRAGYGPDSWEERQAKWFASHLLLPRHLLTEMLMGREVGSITDMYHLRDHCRVTFTMMRIALEQIGRGYVDEDGRVHPSRQEYNGQGRLT